MPVENFIKNLQPADTSTQLPMTLSLENASATGGLPLMVECFNLPTQLLQLKWQLFYVQKSQQELATAILQLSSMILAKSAQPSLPQPPLVPLNLPTPQSPKPVVTKRRWNSKENLQPKMRKVSPNRVRLPKHQLLQQPLGPTPFPLMCQCDACRSGEGDPFLPQPPPIPKLVTDAPPANRTPLDLYVSYFFNNLENKSPPMAPLGAAVEAAPTLPKNNPVSQLQEVPLDLATHPREQSSALDPSEAHPTPIQPAAPETSFGLLASPHSLDLSTPRSSSPYSLYQQAKSVQEPTGIEDLIQLEEASSNNLKPVWNHSYVAVEKDRAILVPNPVEPREMFVGGDPKVRLPIWAYKKCVYMVGREQKRPAGRLCLCLLQSLFSLRYLVSHNYSGSRQKRPIDPLVMKAVLKQAMMQFGGSDGALAGAEFSQGKLRDYLNNAFRVMAFRRRRGDRVKSPFWNDAGDPILTLDPPKDFRLNDIIQIKTVTSLR